MANSATKRRSRGPVECSTDRPSAAPSYVQWVWWLLLPAVSMIEPPPRMSPLTVSVPAISTGPSRLIRRLETDRPVADPHLAGADPHHFAAVAMRSPVVTQRGAVVETPGLTAGAVVRRRARIAVQTGNKGTH